MWNELRVGPAGQGPLDPGEDHGQRVVLGDPAHGFRERLGCGVFADLPGVGLPERQEASRQINLGGGLTRGESHTRCGGGLLGGLGGRREGERSVPIRPLGSLNVPGTSGDIGSLTTFLRRRLRPLGCHRLLVGQQARLNGGSELLGCYAGRDQGIDHLGAHRKPPALGRHSWGSLSRLEQLQASQAVVRFSMSFEPPRDTGAM